MDSVRVFISFQPQLYADIFRSILGSLQAVGIVGEGISEQSFDSSPNDSAICFNGDVDIVLTFIDKDGQPALDSCRAFPKAKIIALATNSDYGYRRMPGADRWEVIRPFSLSRLLFEIFRNPQYEIPEPLP